MTSVHVVHVHTFVHVQFGIDVNMYTCTYIVHVQLGIDVNMYIHCTLFM